MSCKLLLQFKYLSSTCLGICFWSSDFPPCTVAFEWHAGDTLCLEKHHFIFLRNVTFSPSPAARFDEVPPRSLSGCTGHSNKYTKENKQETYKNSAMHQHQRRLTPRRCQMLSSPHALSLSACAGTTSGETVLHRAASLCHRTICHYLVEAGASLMKTDMQVAPNHKCDTYKKIKLPSNHIQIK